MEIKAPMIITSRLKPGVRVADATISLYPTGKVDEDGKPQWMYEFDQDNGYSVFDDDLYGFGFVSEMMGTLLAFMEAAAESHAAFIRNGRPGDNDGLFNREVAEWAYQNSDEISMVRMELEEQ